MLKPSDIGFMNGKPVLDVQRKGAEAHHFIHDSSSLPPFHIGQVVHSTIDWKRRHDHMQQHSGMKYSTINRLLQILKIFLCICSKVNI